MEIPIPVGEKLKKFFKISKGRMPKELSELKKNEILRISERIFIDAINKGSYELLKRAKKGLGLPNEEIVLRGLIPDDLELKEPLSTFNLKKGWNKDVIDIQEVDNWFGVWGFTIPKNCSISQIDIWYNKARKRIYHIQGMEGTYLLNDPFLINQGDLFSIDMYSSSNKKQELIFHGSVTELKGRRIIP